MQETTRSAGLAEWETFVREGRQYRNLMKGARRRPAVFTPEIVYNVAGMALEKLAMGLLMQRGMLAECHTLRGLMAALQPHMDIPDALQRDILFMEGFQEICALEDYHRSAPDPGALQRIVDAVDALADLIEAQLLQGSART